MDQDNKLNDLGLNTLGEPESPEDIISQGNSTIINEPGPEAIILELPSGYKITLSSQKYDVLQLSNLALDVLDLLKKDIPKRNGEGKYYG